MSGSPHSNVGTTAGRPGGSEKSRLGLARPRVAWIAGEDTLETYAASLGPLAVGLTDELVDLTVFCPHEPADIELPCPPAQMVRYTWPSWLFGKRRVAQVAEELRRRKVTVLHALDTSVFRLTRDLAAAAGARWVVSGYRFDDGRRMKHLDDRIAAVLPASEPIRQKMLKRRNVPPEKVRLVRPGVYPIKRAECFSDPKHSVAIVTVCKAPKRQALTALLGAFAELRRRGRDCVFIIVGADQAEGHLRERSGALGLQHEVTIAPRPSRSQMMEIFQAADIYISLGRSETVDVTSLLAMAAGTPVLAGDMQDDFLIEGQTALSFKPGSATSLAGRLLSVLDDRAAARSLAEGALAHVREHHSPARMVSAVTEAYGLAFQ